MQSRNVLSILSKFIINSVVLYTWMIIYFFFMKSYKVGENKHLVQSNEIYDIEILKYIFTI